MIMENVTFVGPEDNEELEQDAAAEEITEEETAEEESDTDAAEENA
jgi:hypothetical protein